MTVGNRLTNMEFDEISLVTRPANQLSKVVLFKSDDTEEHNMADEDTTTDVEKDDETVDLPQEVFEYITALEQANAELMEQIDKMYEGDTEDDGSEDILKSADPRIVELVKAATERAEAAEMIAKAERDFRLERDFVSKAHTLDSLPLDAEAFGKVLKSVAESVSSDDFAAVWRVLEAANNGMRDAGMFKEIGKSSGTHDDGPASTIEKAAARIREQHPSMSREQAISKALELDPNLYTAYLREVK